MKNLFVLLCLGLILTCSSCGRKEQPSAVLPEYNMPKVSEKDNAAPYIMEAVKLFVKYDAGKTKGTDAYDKFMSSDDYKWKDEYEGLMPFVQKNVPALRKFEKAAEKKLCIFPWAERLDFENQDFNYGYFRELIMLELYRAARDINSGNYDNALKIYDRIFTVSKLIRQGDYSLFNYMMGISGTSLGMKGIKNLIQCESAPLSAIIVLMKKTDKELPPPREFIVKDFRSLCLILSSHVEDLAASFSGSTDRENSTALTRKMAEIIKSRRRFFAKSIVKDYEKLGKKRFSRIIELIEEKDWAGLKKVAKKKKSFLSEIAIFDARRLPYLIAEGLIDDAIEFIALRPVIANEISRADIRSIEVIAAAKLYRRENGKYPEKLEDLVPKFLESIPADPFDGKPLRWKKTEKGWVVFSAGPDKVDDGAKKDLNDIENFEGTDIIFYAD